MTILCGKQRVEPDRQRARAASASRVDSRKAGMKLFHHPVSANSQKVLFAFYERCVEFEPVIVDMFKCRRERGV